MHKEFDACIRRHSLLIGICINARSRAITDTSGKFLENIKYAHTGDQRPSRTSIDSDFDLLHKKIDDGSFIELISSFEKIVFQKINNATGSIRKIVCAEYIKPEPFAISSDKFIKDAEDIGSLKKIKGILDGKIPSGLSSRLEEIINQRNRVAHGRRFGIESSITLIETANVLDEVLKRIKDH